MRNAHWMRNALSYVPRAHQSMAAAALRQAHVQPDRASASQTLRHVADQLRGQWPKLGGFIDDSETDVLAHMDFPAQHRTKIHSSRAGSFGGQRPPRDPNRAPEQGGQAPGRRRRHLCERMLHHRLIGAVLLEANDEWRTQSRYTRTEAMAELTPLLTDAVLTQISTQAA